LKPDRCEFSGQRPPDDATLAHGIEFVAPLARNFMGPEKLKAPISGG